MFVSANTKTVHTQSPCMLMLYFHTASYNVVFLITMEPNAKYRFRAKPRCFRHRVTQARRQEKLHLFRRSGATVAYTSLVHINRHIRIGLLSSIWGGI